MNKYKMAIFDLDGVLVDTSKYHYLAWKSLADILGFEFTSEHNERLKSVSRKQSLDILLEIGGIQNKFSEFQKERMLIEKNNLYINFILKLNPTDLLPGAEEVITTLKNRGIKIGIGSSNKNCSILLNVLSISSNFDIIIDGNKTEKTKPDPEVFLLAANAMGIPTNRCVVFEDSQAGIDAANAADMVPIGIGNPKNLKGSHICISSLEKFNINSLF